MLVAARIAPGPMMRTTLRSENGGGAGSSSSSHGGNAPCAGFVVTGTGASSSCVIRFSAWTGILKMLNHGAHGDHRAKTRRHIVTWASCPCEHRPHGRDARVTSNLPAFALCGLCVLCGSIL